ncbi:MAG: oligosaccharide flippase family protein [Actinomycetota bacterium]|nr:oligosaccharide flippase family protein [Actinomycetota bacterium]
MGFSSIICAPFYLHFLGVEAYGLIGFFLTLLSVSNLLDLGLSSAINRELARFSARPGEAREARDLVRTLELVYWSLAAVVGTTIWLLAPALAGGWLNASQLPVTTVRSALMVMGLALAAQWPLSLYSGGLMGLQRQVLLNAVLVVTATVRNFGAVLLLWLLTPSVIVFFAWQAVASLAHTLVTAVLLWRSLPDGEAPRFQRSALIGIWRFAAGVGVTSALAVVITQMDKVVLSKILSLREFGYYSLATAVASGLTFLVLPIFQAVFPRFSALVARDEPQLLSRVYHQACQLMAAVVLPIAAVLALFSAEVLKVWTGDADTVQQTDRLLALLVVGTALNSLMNVPYALQLALGWTRLALYLNAGAVVVFLPLLVVATSHQGAIAGAAIWVLVNAGYLLVGINAMHSRLLRGEKRRWVVQDVGRPLAAALGVTLVARVVMSGAPSRAMTALWLLVVLGGAAAACVLATPATREWARRLVTRREALHQQSSTAG